MSNVGSRWLAERLGLFISSGAMSQQLLTAIAADADKWTSKASSIYRGEQTDVQFDERVRSSRRLYPPDTIATELSAALSEQLEPIAEHFDVELHTLEEVQLLSYSEGGHFTKHRDGRTNTDGSVPSIRRISLVAFLSSPDNYTGGEFVLFPDSIDTHGRGLGFRLEAGDLLAFPADLEHQVTPIIHGRRISAVTWAA